jgi:tripartite ATP-independent transporter DctP family solute receptor
MEENMKTAARIVCAWKAIMLLAAAACLAPAHAQIAKRDIRIAIGSDEKSPKGLAVRKFAELVSQRSGGKINVTLFANGKLGDDAKTVADARNGALDMAVPDTATLVDQIKGFGILNFPFLFDTEADADKLLDGSFGNKLNASLDGIGLVGLGYWENGFRHVTNSVRPVASIKDFRGLKMRVIKNPMYIDTFNALGATPVPLSFPEVYGALQENKIDGQENPLATILSSKFYSMQKYLTLTRHSYSVWVMLMSKHLWNKLSQEEQALIRACALEARDFERTMMRANSGATLAELRRLGMLVSEPTSVERSEWRRMTRPIIEKYKHEFGTEWAQAMYMGMMQNEVAKFKKD